MIRIGDFSKLGRISIKCLRHYDDLNLLKPAYVDADNGYRYYKAEQLSTLQQLVSLKELGFTLEEIGILLHAPLDQTQFLSLLEKRRQETLLELARHQERLRQIDAAIQTTQRRTIPMSAYEVTVRPIPAMLVASVKDTSPDCASFGVTFNRLFDEVIQHITANGNHFGGPGFDLITNFPDADIPVEAAIPLSQEIPPGERVKVHTMPAVENMACAIHRGGFDGLPGAFDALAKWIEDNGYRIDGAQREVYLEYERDGDPANYVTEIQMPVVKAA